LWLLAGSTTAMAGSIEFNFDNMAPLTGTHINSSGIDQGATANSASIQSFMQTTLNGAGVTGVTVNVTGAIANSGYTGDNNVSKTTTNGYWKTLANFTNATTSPYAGSFPSGTDTGGANPPNGDGFIAKPHVFIMNNNLITDSGYGPKSNFFTISFTGSGGLTLQGIQFNWEVFPSASCSNHCVFNLYAGTGAAPTTDAALAALTPVFTTNTGSANQAVAGLQSAAFNNATWFIVDDWPPEVAITGVDLTYTCCKKVPEPDSVSLVGLALAAGGMVAGWRRRRLNS
jgi:hypothetical protein